MKEHEARQLKIGDRIKFCGYLGTVTDVNQFGFEIKWDDNQNGWVDNRDAKGFHKIDNSLKGTEQKAAVHRRLEGETQDAYFERIAKLTGAWEETK